MFVFQNKEFAISSYTFSNERINYPIIKNSHVSVNE